MHCDPAPPNLACMDDTTTTQEKDMTVMTTDAPQPPPAGDDRFDLTAEAVLALLPAPVVQAIRSLDGLDEFQCHQALGWLAAEYPGEVMAAVAAVRGAGAARP